MQESYVIDPHTAVAVAVAEEYKLKTGDSRKIICASTANPYKFPVPVLSALGVKTSGLSESQTIAALSEKTGTQPHRALSGLEELPILHSTVVEKSGIKQALKEILK